MGGDANYCYKVTSDVCKDVKDPKMVEEWLEQTCKKLSETEINIGLFSKMIRNGVATNDVRNFVQKQARLKCTNQKMCLAMSRKAMKNKVVDACSLAHKLRKQKIELCNLLKSRFKYPGRKCRRIVKNILCRASNHRQLHRKKTRKKYLLCEKKMVEKRDINNTRDIPNDAWEVLKGVNLFGHDTVVPEQPAEPMVCSSDITLSKAERAFLRKGPRYMLRMEVSETDFKAELEKMSVKDKFNALNNGELEDPEHSSNSLSEEADREATKAAMVYLKSDRSLDMNKMKATDYKFNRQVFLPKHETAERESLHELRRMTMLDAFRQVTKMNNKKKDANLSKQGLKSDNDKVGSNLTRAEMAGLKSLQKRVQSGELIITETDKSKRFCILKSDQYTAAGQKHVGKDLKVSCDDVRTVQKLVNDHSTWIRKIFGFGAGWGHEDRLGYSMTDRGEVVAPLYLLIKDHKGWTPEDGSPPHPDQCVVETLVTIDTSAKCYL